MLLEVVVSGKERFVDGNTPRAALDGFIGG